MGGDAGSPSKGGSRRTRRVATRLSRIDKERLAKGELASPYQAVREPEPQPNLTPDEQAPGSTTDDARLKENLPPHW